MQALTKKCPLCAEEIQSEAIKCRHCGSMVTSGAWAVPGAVHTPRSVSSSGSVTGFAIASLVLGIVWVYWVGSVLALVFGYMAKREIRESHGTRTGDGLATAGIVLGWVGVGALVITILVVAIAVGSSDPYAAGVLQ